MTKLEASITQLLNKAATGDLKAMKVFLQMASRFFWFVKGPSPPFFPNGFLFHLNQKCPETIDALPIKFTAGAGDSET